MQTLSIDIETYSSINLQKAGVYRYVEAPDFEILLFGYSIDSGPVQVVDRYHELRDSYDTTGFRKAVINTQLDIEDQLNKIGIFTVSFSCLPFRYLDEGQEAITITESPYTVKNPTVFQAKPYIKVSGSGTGRLSVNSSLRQSPWDFTDIGGYIEIDSEQMNFYKAAEPRNNRVSGSGFPILYPGYNDIVFSGGITSVTIIPRWVTL